MRSIQLLEDTARAQLRDREFPLPWLKPLDADVNMSDPEDWDPDGADPNAEEHEIVDDDGAVLYSAMNAAVEDGLAPGSSRDMTAPSQMWTYTAFGYYESGNERFIIQMGYLKRM